VCRLAAEATTMEEANRLPAYSKIGQFRIKGMRASLPLGLLFMLGAFGWAIVLTPPIVMAWIFAKWFDPLRRRIVDKVVSLWAWGACLAMLYFPKLEGRENLPGKYEAVMYIPNHTSYLDIFTLSGCIPRSFKYVSKQEILQVLLPPPPPFRCHSLHPSSQPPPPLSSHPTPSHPYTEFPDNLSHLSRMCG